MVINITGASGFVGSNLSKHLKNNLFFINEISLRSQNWRGLINPKSDALIHLAGKAHDTNNTSESAEYFTINRDLTIDLFDFFIHSNIQDFIYFSSVKAVADTVDGILDEDASPNPKTPYGQSKLDAENYLLSQSLPLNKRLFIIRPCMIHGEGNKGNLNFLYSIIKRGIPWPLGMFNNQRSFVSIDNLNFLIESLLTNKKIESGVYNLADDYPISTNELVALIADALNKKTILWNMPRFLIKSIARLGDFIPVFLNSERLKKLTESYVVSNEKIKAALAIKKLPLSPKEGLTKTIISFKKKI